MTTEKPASTPLDLATEADASGTSEPVRNPQLSALRMLRDELRQATPPVCPTREPEVHELGEFPMTCYRCHLEADS